MIELPREEELVVPGDFNLLCTVFRNFTNNALKFTEKGGRILLTAEKNHREIDLLVKDNGTGMSEDRIRKIKRQEFQSREGTEKEKGTGLGLLISKELMDEIDGEWIIESEEGKGTVMGLRIIG